MIEGAISDRERVKEWMNEEREAVREKRKGM